MSAPAPTAAVPPSAEAVAVPSLPEPDPVRMGEMRAVVTATGMRTYFGRTARLVQEAGTRSHFQQAVLRIGNFLILVTCALVALILLVAIERRAPLVETLLFALILTVAAIPVALPAVLSVTTPSR